MSDDTASAVNAATDSNTTTRVDIINRDGKGEDIHVTKFEEEDIPNRVYRRRFVYGSMLVAWATAVVLSRFAPIDSALTRIVVDGCISYCLIMGPSYLIGHSVDRSAILDKVGDAITSKSPSRHSAIKD